MELGTAPLQATKAYRALVAPPQTLAHAEEPVRMQRFR